MVVVVVVVVVAAVVAVAAVEDRDGIQWYRWWGCLMATAVLVVTFNSGGIGMQIGSREMQMQQSN
jgi:hypothetical protein